MSNNKYIFAIEGIVDNEAIYYSNILYRRFKKHIRRLRESKLSVNKLMSMPVELKDKITFYNVLDNTQDVEINERSTIKIPTFTTDIDYYSKIFIETNKANLNSRNLKSIFENKKIANTIIGDKIDYHIDFMKEINEIDLSKEVYIQEASLSRFFMSGYHKIANKSLQTGLSLFTIDTVTQALTGHGIGSFLHKGSIQEIGITGGVAFGAYIVLGLIAKKSKRKSITGWFANFLRDKMKRLGGKSQDIIFGAINAFKKYEVTQLVGKKALKTPLGKIINRIDFDNDATHLITSPKSAIDFSAIKIIEKNDEAIKKSLSAAGITDVNESELEAFKKLGTFSDLLFYLAENKRSDPKYKRTPEQPNADELRTSINDHNFLKVGDKFYLKEESVNTVLANFISSDILNKNTAIRAIDSQKRIVHIDTILPKNKFLKHYKDSSNFSHNFEIKIIEYLRDNQQKIYNNFIENDHYKIELRGNDIIISLLTDNGNKFELKVEFNTVGEKLGIVMNNLKRAFITDDAASFLGVNFCEMTTVAGSRIPPDMVFSIESDALEAINNTEKHEATEEYRSIFLGKAAMISSIVETCSNKKNGVNIKKCIETLVSKDALDVTKLHIALARIGYESASLFTDKDPGIFNAARVFNDAIAATTQNIECNDENGDFSLDVLQKSILENTLLSCLNLESRSKYRSVIKQFTNDIYGTGFNSARIEDLIESIYKINDKKPVTDFGKRMEKLISDSFMEILELQAAIKTSDEDDPSKNRLEQFIRKKFSDGASPEDNEKIEAVIDHIRKTGRNDDPGNIDHGEALWANVKSSISFVLKKGNKTDSELVLGEKNAELLNNILKSSGDCDTIFQQSLALPGKGLTNAPTKLQKWKSSFSSISNLTLKTLAGAGLMFSLATPVIASYLISDALQPSETFQKTVDDGSSSGIKIDMKSLYDELLALRESIDEIEDQHDDLRFDKCFLHLEESLKFAESDNEVGVKKLFNGLGMQHTGSNAENYSNLMSFIYFINDQESKINDCAGSFNQLHERLVRINKADHSEAINKITMSMITKIQDLYKDFVANSNKYEEIKKRLSKISQKILERDKDLVEELPETYTDVDEPESESYIGEIEAYINKLSRGWDTKYVKNSKGEKILVPVNYEELTNQYKDISTSIEDKTITAVTTRARYEAFENNRLVIAINIVKNIGKIVTGYDDLEEVMTEMASKAAEDIKVKALRSSALASGRIEALIKFLTLVLTSIMFRFLKQLKLAKGKSLIPNIQGALIDAQNHIRIATNFTIYHIESHILRNDIISVLDLNTKMMELTLKDLLAREEDNADIKRSLKKISAIRDSIAKETLKSSKDDKIDGTDDLLRKLDIIP